MEENISRMEEKLQAEQEERGRLELEAEKLRQEKEMLEEQRERERGETPQRVLAQSKDPVITIQFFGFIVTFRALFVYERQTGAPGAGGAAVQRGGLCSAGQTGLCEQGQSFSGG